jgi:hypothetical protein
MAEHEERDKAVARGLADDDPRLAFIYQGAVKGLIITDGRHERAPGVISSRPHSEITMVGTFRRPAAMAASCRVHDDARGGQNVRL